MKALVLSGGGTVGAAWMTGFLSDRVDLTEADLIVGTSAGARVGAAVATGTLGDVVAMYDRGEAPRLDVPVGLDAFVAAAMRAAAGAPDRREGARRVANLAPLGPRLVDDDVRRRWVAAHVPAGGWPERRLEIVAVDAATGERAVFDAASGVDLLDAVVASGALPGIFPLTAIGGGRYADGGVRSVYNADLAAGCDDVTILTPMPIAAHLRPLLDAEIAALGDAQVRVIVPDEASLAAIGPNPLAADAAPAALRAGAAQAAR
jgi:NTE family protein